MNQPSSVRPPGSARPRSRRSLTFILTGLFFAGAVAARVAENSAVKNLRVDFTGYHKASGVVVKQAQQQLAIEWPVSKTEAGRVVLNLDSTKPLLEKISVVAAGKPACVLGQKLNPVTWLTVGERDLKNPAGWVAFFDDPNSRPHQTYPAVLDLHTVRVSSAGARTTIHLGEVHAGSFHGELRLSFYRHSPLIHLETVVTTEEDGRAILYDTGLAGHSPDWQRMVWKDDAAAVQQINLNAETPATPLAVAGRALVAESVAGSLAVFPAPHQYFYPVDQVTNLKFVWYGKGYQSAADGFGFGIRQSATGFNHYIPWFNAPPHTEQHLGVFYLISSGDGAQALNEVSAFTHGDRYPKLPGHLTFSSHYHIEHTQELLKRQRAEHTSEIPKDLWLPGFVRTFKARGVDIVHLAEFHLDVNAPSLKDEQRLPLLKAMFSECARLSNDKFLLLPGEEANVQLGGHWLALFPKPVYWVLNRPADKLFAEPSADYGTVYHVGSSEDVLQLMEREHGLMWTAHARIKGSRGFPDNYKAKNFFSSDHFLGAAWKAMPADLSQPRLGLRALDVMDDMENWGGKKQVLGEVDAFRMETNFETYAHMNINYLRLDKLPKFSDGWQSVLDTLRAGKFFVSSGEVLIPRFTVSGQESGATLKLSGAAKATIEVGLQWTFPLAFAEIISGDGLQVFRQRIDLANTESFGSKTMRVPVDLKGRTWVRFEVWDIAANGAFTQPVWLKSE